jgi:hypothetical protein
MFRLTLKFLPRMLVSQSESHNQSSAAGLIEYSCGVLVTVDWESHRQQGV